MVYGMEQKVYSFCMTIDQDTFKTTCKAPGGNVFLEDSTQLKYFHDTLKVIGQANTQLGHFLTPNSKTPPMNIFGLFSGNRKTALRHQTLFAGALEGHAFYCMIQSVHP